MASDTRTLKVVIAGDAKSARAALKTLGAGLQEADKDAKKHKASWDDYWHGVNKILAGVALGVGAAAVGFGTLGIKTAAAMEQSQVGFTTMLGSAEKAKAFLEQLTKFAAATPFELQGLTESSQKLLAMGFAAKDVIPTMTAIGDAVAALGGSQETLDRVVLALGQMKAKGKVSAEEMLQLTEAGIPAWDMLAQKIGTDIPHAMKLVEKGAVSSTTGVTALTEGMEKRFGGLMEKQSHTMAGLWSNLKDTLSISAAKMVQPLVPIIEKWMPALINVAQKAGDVIANKAVPAVASAVHFLSQLVGWIRDNWSWLGPLVVLYGTAAAGIYVLVTALKIWAAIQAIVNLLMSANPIGLVIIAVVALAAAIAYLWTHNETFRKIVIAVWTAIKGAVMAVVHWFMTEVPKAWHWVSDTAVSVFNWLVGFFKSVWQMIVTVVMTPVNWIVNFVKFQFAILRAIWEFIWSAIGDNVKLAWSKILQIIQIGVAIVKFFVNAFLQGLHNMWSLIWSLIGDKVKFVWNVIVTGVQFGINYTVAVIRYGLSVISAIWNAVWGYVSQGAINTWNNITGFIAAAISTVSNGISSALSFISNIWSASWNMTKGIVSAAWGFIKDSVVGGIWNVLNVMSGIPARILAAIGDLGSLLWNSGQKIIQGLIDGIKSMVGKVKDAVGDVLHAASNLLPHSPAKEGPFSGRGWTLYSGQAISESLAAGIRAKAPEVSMAVSAMMGNAHASIGGGDLAVNSLATAAGSTAGVNVTVNVAGTVTAEKDLAKSIATTVRDEIARKAKRNRGNSGL